MYIKLIFDVFNMRTSNLDTMRLTVTGNPEIAYVIDSLVKANPGIRIVEERNISEGIGLYVVEFKPKHREEVLKIVESQRQGDGSHRYIFYSVSISHNDSDKPIRTPTRAA